jgi:hypothetical protein
MIPMPEKLAALDALGFDCDTSGGEIVAWRDARPQPASWQEVIDLAAPILAARATRAEARATLAAQWAGLPPYIRGPFGAQFEAAARLLDAGDDEAAAALIEFSAAPAGYDPVQLATFTQVRASLALAIAALPPAP